MAPGSVMAGLYVKATGFGRAHSAPVHCCMARLSIGEPSTVNLELAIGQNLGACTKLSGTTIRSGHEHGACAWPPKSYWPPIAFCKSAVWSWQFG